MIRKFATVIFTVFLLVGTSLPDVTAYAAPSNGRNVQLDVKYPLAGGLIGGAGTVFILAGMSRTKKKATHADHAIDSQNSHITHREDKYIRTERVAKKKVEGWCLDYGESYL